MLRKLTLAALISLTLFGCSTANRSAGVDNSLLPARSDIRHYTLDNGLQVYLLPRSQPGVEMRLLVKSGSLQESEQQLGLAHFTEHMAFKGTTHFPGTTGFKQLEQQGLKLGSHVNAITSLNSTLYKLSLPAATPAQVNTSLQVMADWAQGMTFESSAFEKERPVIVEEWRLRQGIGFRINDQLEKLRYHGSRYINRNPIGSLDVVRQAPIEQAIDYYKKWYQPQRMTLIIIGDFNSSTVLNDVKQHFNLPVPAQLSQDDPLWQKFAPSTEMLIQPVFDKEQGARFVQFSLQKDVDAPLNTEKGQYSDLLDSLWITILNQRFSVLVDNGVLPSISINSQGAMLDNRRLQQLMIAHPKGDDYLAATKVLFTELQRMATSPVTQSELDEARQSLLKKLSQQAATEQRYDHDYLAGQITTALEYDMPVWNKRQQLDISHKLMKDVTPETLKQHVEQLLEVTSPRLALIGPDSDAKNFDKSAFQSQWKQIRTANPGPFAQKSQAIELNVVPTSTGKISSKSDLPVAKTEIWQLSNQIKVIVKSDKTLTDNIQISLQIPGGRSLETQQTAGLTDWALKLPESSGYGDYSARELALFAKQNQLAIRPYSELLSHGYRGEAPVDQLDTALKLLHLKLTAPQFSGQKLEQNKQAFALSLKNVPVERLFLDSINREAYQNGEMLVINPQGGWNSFSAQQLQQTNRQLLSSTANMTLVISGAINSSDVKAAVERWIASLPASNSNLMWRDQGIMPKMASMTQTYPISSSDKSMVSIQYASPAQWTLQEQLEIQLLDTIVSQRLRTELREKASGIYALGFSQMLAKLPAPYYSARLNFTTSPERAKEMVALSQKAIEQLRQQGVTAKELDEAKNIWLTERNQITQSASYWTEALAQIAGDDQQFNRINNEPSYIQQITVDQVNNVIQKYLGKNEKVFLMSPKQ